MPEMTIALEDAEWLALQNVALHAGELEPDLARAWVVERLGLLPSVFRADPVPTETELADPRERLRARYRPDDLQILFVGESAPAGGTFFYQADSNLFGAVREAAIRAHGPLAEGASFLDWFRDQGFWLHDLSAKPVNRSRGRPRKDAVEAGTFRLARLLRETDPEHVIVVGTSLEPTVRAASRLAGYREPDIRVLPFPLYQWRESFVGQLAAFLAPEAAAQVPKATAAPARQRAAAALADHHERLDLHDAMDLVLRRSPRPRLRSREIANLIAADDLYRRRDGGHPPASQVSARARKYPRMFDVTPAGIARLGG